MNAYEKRKQKKQANARERRKREKERREFSKEWHALAGRRQTTRTGHAMKNVIRFCAVIGVILIIASCVEYVA